MHVQTGQINADSERRSHYALRKPSWDPKKADPRNRETADHSFHYCVAVSLLDGACGPEQFTQEKLNSADVRRLMASTELVADPEFTKLWPKSSGAAVRVWAEGGVSYQEVCKYPPGHPVNRLSAAEVETKFRRLTGTLLSEGQKRAILDAVWQIERSEDVGEIMALLVA